MPSRAAAPSSPDTLPPACANARSTHLPFTTSDGATLLVKVGHLTDVESREARRRGLAAQNMLDGEDDGIWRTRLR
jgi:hypothetical protein